MGSGVLEKTAQVDVNACDDELTALHLAAERGREAIVELLLDREADVNSLGKGQKTALSRAAPILSPKITLSYRLTW